MPSIHHCRYILPNCIEVWSTPQQYVKHILKMPIGIQLPYTQTFPNIQFIMYNHTQFAYSFSRNWYIQKLNYFFQKFLANLKNMWLEIYTNIWSNWTTALNQLFDTYILSTTDYNIFRNLGRYIITLFIYNLFHKKLNKSAKRVPRSSMCP